MEEDIVSALTALFSGQVFPDTAPHDAIRPFCIYQQVGGRPSNTFCGDTDKQNARVQFWVWANTREEANTMMRAAAAALAAAPLLATAMAPLTSVYNDITKSYGAQQDFSIWWDTTTS